ncbi:MULTISPECIES: hypothetical protein [Micromonospora]|uniref:Uncharacterized protein n=1 Tax=Micromonospora yangpuensis TaxID=683228 RepID=A0A1C6U883_9ACTN|nr:hypothetical protein [Micromonospora yangpuensis]GGL89670.1 hypothetical protein GCM10012279_04120 [Micromonospora yangpuensis]SCL50184.1 hypothetical protein GA0070617_1405 [Micromonospora yangpuensis]
MARTDSTGTWRYRWAHRENDRLRQAYRDAELTWRRRDEELRRMRAAALGFRAAATAAPGLPLELDSDERVHWVAPAAQLVESRHSAVLPAPELSVPVSGARPRPRRPDGLRVLDTGLAVITNHRLVLLGGRGRRDWAYGRISGLAHDPAAPVTLIQVLDRRPASGLLLPPATVAEFRLTLTLAFADVIEQGPAVVAQLDELIAEHDQVRPFRPEIVTPAQAQFTARVPGGRRTVAAAAAGLLLIPAVLVDSDPPGPTGTQAAVAATGEVAAPVAATARPATSPTRTRSPKPRRATGGGTATPSPRDRFCGAPRNPFGYDFCDGQQIWTPATEFCDWFSCGQDFQDGRGYLVQCRDGSFSRSGGQPDACDLHRGVRRTLHS